MPDSTQVDLPRLQSAESELKARYQAFRDQKLSLDMTRGKPCAEQLDLSLPLLDILGRNDFRSPSGTDTRNYGGVDGLPEAKELFAPLLDVASNEVIVGGNSSLQLMHQVVTQAMLHGVPGGNGSWQAGGAVKFVCPAPGYDRHFALCEHLGIEMIPVEMKGDGPDMDRVESLVGSDERIKGLWLVPRHSNPTGVTVSEAVVKRLAAMSCAAPDFRLMWDNAYSVHHLDESPPPLANILEACKAAGQPDRPFLFGSTSKISFAGAGVAVVGGSTANMDWFRGHLSMMTIGPDKLNQLRHVRFFKDADGIAAHMKKHAEILRPKFAAVNTILERDLAPLSVASWNQPQGGYFINFDTVDGCATRVVQLAKEARVKLTGAGATFPYGKDPKDSNIRLAPTLPPLSELRTAMEVFTTCVRLATLERLSR